MKVANEDERRNRVVGGLLWITYMTGMALFWIAALLLVGFIGHLVWSLVRTGWRWAG